MTLRPLAGLAAPHTLAVDWAIGKIHLSDNSYGTNPITTHLIVKLNIGS